MRIAGLAARLPWRAGQRVVHCSGALGLDVLEAGARRGRAARLLPSAADLPRALRRSGALRGIAIGIEGDGELDAELRASVSRARRDAAVARRCRSRALSRRGGVREQLRGRAARGCGARVRARRPAARCSARGARAADARDAPTRSRACRSIHALTGPIARGDTRTVERHLHALAGNPELRALYARLGAALLELPLSLAPERRAALEALLAAVV